MSNCILNEIKRFAPRDPPWITKPLKTMLRRKDRLLKSYKIHDYRADDTVRLDAFVLECQQAVENSKLSYLTALGNKVNNTNSSQKSCWKNVHRVMNKCRAPKIPPIFVNNLYVLSWIEKAKP